MLFLPALGHARNISGPPAGLQVAQVGSGAPGLISSVAYAPVTPGLSFVVAPFDDSELNLAIKERFEHELRGISRTISDKAVLELSFETRVVQGRFGDNGPNLGSLEAGTNVGRESSVGLTPGARREVEVRLNVWSSTKDSILGGRQRTGSRRANVFHMNAVLRDQRSGKVLWQGDAYSEMIVADELRIARSMVRPLVASIGRTVKGEPFELE